jgi:PEP-CTERM motif
MTKMLQIFSCAALFMLPGVASADIVYNGGFETGDFTGWILSGNPIPGDVDSSLPHSGLYEANLFAAGSLGYLEQFLPTTPGTLYNLAYFLNSDGGTPNEFLAQLNGTMLIDQTNIPSRNYTQYSFSFQATSTSTDLKFGFRDDPGSLHLDDVSVTPVPEPASMWLGVLMIGAAAAKRRGNSRRDSI